MQMIRIKHRWRLVLAALALTACAAAWAQLGARDTPEVREIKGRVSQQLQRIASLEVSFRVDTRSDWKPSELRALADFQNQLFLPKEETTEAFKGEKRYRRVVQPERVQWLAETDEFGLVPPVPVDPKAPALIQERQKSIKAQYDRTVALLKAQAARGRPRGPRDPSVLPISERDVTRAYNGRSLWMKHPQSEGVNEIQVWPVKKNAHWFGPSVYLSAIGIQPSDPTEREVSVLWSQESHRLVDWFKRCAYEKEKDDVIDQATCVVLKGSLNSLMNPSLAVGELTDRIWLDRDHGWGIRKREMAKGSQVLIRWEATDLREVEPGLWLPMLVRRSRFANDAPAHAAGKPAVVEEVRVKSISVNQVPDDRFDMVPDKSDVIEDLRGML